MSEKKWYECPHCGCQDRFGEIKDMLNEGVQWNKADGKWKKVLETVGTLGGFSYCPECGKQLPNSAVLKWLKEPRED